MPKRKPTVVGQRFGWWEIISDDDVIKSCGRRWTLCRCKCGTVRRVMRSRLFSGATKSCGCWQFRDLGQPSGGSVFYMGKRHEAGKRMARR